MTNTTSIVTVFSFSLLAITGFFFTVSPSNTGVDTLSSTFTSNGIVFITDEDGAI